MFSESYPFHWHHRAKHNLPLAKHPYGEGVVDSLQSMMKNTLFRKEREMRKFLSFFFSIALAMTMLPAAAFAVPDDGESQLVDVPQASEATLVIEPQVGNIATGTWGTCPWEISEDGVLTVRPGEGANTTDVNYSPWIAYVDSITKVFFVRDGGKRVIAPATCTALFARMPNITEIDFSGFDTSKTTAMNEMFIQCG